MEPIIEIKAARDAVLVAETAESSYITTIENCWLRLLKMARKNKLIRTNYMTYAGVKFDYGSTEKDAAALKQAIETGIVPDPKDSNVAPSEASSQPDKLFSELFEEFIAYKTDPKVATKEGRNPLPEKSQKEYRRYFDAIVEIMSDMRLGSIDKKAVKDALLTYRQLPKRNLKPYKGQPVSELLEMEIPEEHLVANKTVEAVRKLMQGIFRYALDADYIPNSPARDLNLKLDISATFAPYTKHEAAQLLQAAAEEKKVWQRWLPILAAYTGARRAELVQLRKQDIKLDPDSQRHYMLITDDAGKVKTENAIRQVPLHQALIEAGFLEFVGSATDRLFDELKPQAVTGWFSRLRDKLAIEKFDDFGNRKVFHSFRHTFITQSRGAGNSADAVQQVVGHERSNAGTTDRYTHRFPLEDVLCVVDKVLYK
jgi:integrase